MCSNNYKAFGEQDPCAFISQVDFTRFSLHHCFKVKKVLQLLVVDPGQIKITALQYTSYKLVVPASTVM